MINSVTYCTKQPNSRLTRAWFFKTKDHLWNNARIWRTAVKHTPESPYLWRKPVWHMCLPCQSDQTSSPACVCMCERETGGERKRERERLAGSGWGTEKNWEECEYVLVFGAYPDISLCGDGFPLVQVNHFWGTIWKSRVPAQRGLKTMTSWQQNKQQQSQNCKRFNATHKRIWRIYYIAKT